MKILNRHIKLIASLLTVNMLFNIGLPSVMFALTGGPSQPEVQTFTPVGTSDMVNLFTGDFGYNIPLFELPGPNGGYPFNLAYNAGIGMEQEASWVGLGWNINPGAITRQMRGLPDDFSGEKIKTNMHIKTNKTIGGASGKSLEFFGADESVGRKLGLGFGADYEISLFHNTYKGLGYSFSNSLFLSLPLNTNINTNTTFNSHDGVTKSFGGGISVGKKIKDSNTRFSLGLNYRTGRHSRIGLLESTLGLSTSLVTTFNSKGVSSIEQNKQALVQSLISYSAPLSNTNPGYTPQISMPMKGKSLSISVAKGAGIGGFYLKKNIRGFYNDQKLANNYWENDAYGFLNFDKGKDDPGAVMDFNRYKDGVIRKETPNLGIPALTYDIYSVNGQGMSAMYRPYRSDIGVVFDPQTVSRTKGGGIGYEAGNNHIGTDGSINSTKSVSGKWKLEDTNTLDFKSKSEKALNYEPYYFKVYGEATTNLGQENNGLDLIGNEEPVRMKINGMRMENSFESGQNNYTQRNLVSENRVRRNTAIIPITNKQLLDDNNDESLSLFKLDSNHVPGNFDRGVNAKNSNQLAGFISTNPDGLRYVYALPLKNNKQVETLYSIDYNQSNVDKTVLDSVENNGSTPTPRGYDEYLKRTEIPEFAHSFMLTSIVGPDYVDLTNNGVTEDDLGYWVKFTYQKRDPSSADPYKWRAPYYGANINHGFISDRGDDKASYMYGEKEIWYLHTAETKSHLAVFELNDLNDTTDKRNDALGVIGEFHNSSDNNNHNIAKLRKLNNIKLYTRAEKQLEDLDPTNVYQATPIKNIFFKYAVPDETLCQGIPNASDNGGKLTLKEVYFTYGMNSRGKLSPYKFHYNSDYNYNYDLNAVDRWGNYKPDDNPSALNKDFPYVDQYESKENHDNNAKAWNLSQIDLPSGATIHVEYEADTYAYVQHKTAMQMTPLTNSEGETTSIDNSSRYPLHGSNSDKKYLDENNNEEELLKIYFKLENAIPDSLVTDDAYKAKVIDKYIKDIVELQEETGSPQLYFKTKINLQRFEQGKTLPYAWVAGYAEINAEGPKSIVKANESDSTYTVGYFSLKHKTVKGKKIHPFRYAALQHMQANQPNLMQESVVSLDSDDGKVNGLIGIFKRKRELELMYKGFYEFAIKGDGNGWANEMILGQSMVRLTTPDLIKYGGGHRVKKIVLNDNWDPENDGSGHFKSIYGQTYEYHSVDENGNEYSNGVAAYEPLIGGDEIPLRYAKGYTQAIPLKTGNELYFEYPINESYYPGPTVGYSKVTVKSLPSAMKEGTLTGDETQFFPTKEFGFYATTGATTHEFYTAKDFPVIAKETEIFKYMPKISVRLKPLLGTRTYEKAAATQGYSIVLNDMHGKSKKVSNYEQDPTTGEIYYDHPISWVKYNYKKEEDQLNGKSIFKLLNQVTTISKDITDPNAIRHDLKIGEQFEFFIDTRMFETKASQLGVSGNVDLAGTVPIPSAWPNENVSKTEVKTVVTNKIISKIGILESTEAFDGGSLVKTTNEAWNAETGDIAITSVTNNFGEKIYSYAIPAYKEYPQMGHAYQNIGITFNATLSQEKEDSHYYTFVPDDASLLQNEEYKLVEGDEFILSGSESNSVKTTAIYLGTTETGLGLLYVQNKSIADDAYEVFLYRSGRRNQLSASVGSITYKLDSNATSILPVKYEMNKHPFDTSTPQDFEPTVFESAEFINPLCEIWNFETCECDDIYKIIKFLDKISCNDTTQRREVKVILFSGNDNKNIGLQVTLKPQDEDPVIRTLYQNSGSVNSDTLVFDVHDILLNYTGKVSLKAFTTIPTGGLDEQTEDDTYNGSCTQE